MNNFFTDNFVDYDDPPIDSSSNLTPETRDFSLTSPNSDSTGLYPTSHSPQAYAHNYSLAEPLNFDVTTYTNQEQPLQIKEELQEVSKKGSRRKAKATTPAYIEEHSSENSSEGKILDKSKRIQKRAAAKERTKEKLKQTSDLCTMFAGIDAKFLPEGYDDPNLDERTKKKMIQMVRNRISAQNSRDRKKGYMQELEQINAKLEEDCAALAAERDNLMTQLQNAQNEIQMLRENGTQVCPNCQNVNKEDPFIITSHDGIQNDDEPAGGFSGLSSPRLARFASSRSGFLGMFAFIGMIAMVAVVNIGGNEQYGLHSGPLVHLKETRMLDVQSDSTTGENIVKNGHGYVTQVIPDYSKSLVLQNIHKIKNNFDQTCDATFKDHLQKLAPYSGVSLKNEVNEVETIELTLENDNRNGIVKYDSAKASSNFRRKAIPTVLANSPPAISDIDENGGHTSTLFCSSGHEFYDNGTQNIRIGKNNLTNNNTLDVEKADYLQLLVPKSTIARSNVRNRLTDIYGQAIINDESDNDTMLEIWCKVFMVRELPSY